MKHKEIPSSKESSQTIEEKRRLFERFMDSGAVIRIGVLVLVVGLGGFLLWAAFAPLDEGVPVSGAVIVSTKSKVVQHLRGGIVESVRVHEGEMVEQGDVLLALADQEVLARYRETYERYLVLRASEARLDVLDRGGEELAFHDDLLYSDDEVLARAIMQNQRVLFMSQQAELRSLRLRLTSVQEMVAEGYMPLFQQLELEERLANLESKVASERAGVQMQVESFKKRSLALQDELERSELRSPASGQVVGLMVQTVGAVITPGQVVMEIVPFDEDLIVEVHVDPQFIDRISSGMPADIRFHSFAHSPMMMVEGVVESVSHDLLHDPQRDSRLPGASYYLARISLTKQGLASLGNRELQAGMPVQVVIKTGERSLLTYLLKPFLNRLSASLKEE